MNVFVPRERANRVAQADRQADHSGPDLSNLAAVAPAPAMQRAPAPAPSDALSQSLNDRAAVRSLTQLGAALTATPRVQGQAALQRALNPDEETVAQPARPAGRAVFQLARLNLRLNNTISGVSAWPHRPSSNVSGSQGQHLTAYVSFQDMILSRVRDRTVPEAANELIDLLDTMSELLGTPTWTRDYGATVEVNKELLRSAARDNNAELVGDVINNILALRNVMPDTAIATAERTWGHGEAGTSGSLEVLETILRQAGGDLPERYDAETEANAALYNMWRLLDFQPPTGASEMAFGKTKDRVYRHLVQMRLSYPQVFDWLTRRGSRLLTYIKDNRAEEGMPLADLSDGEIDEITEYIMG